MLAPAGDFRHNYIAAWRQRHGRRICVVYRDALVRIPMPTAENDEIMLEHLRMFYNLLAAESELRFLRTMDRINRVEASC